MQLNDNRLLVITSFGGGYVPAKNVVETLDYLELYVNGVNHPDSIISVIKQISTIIGFKNKLLLFSEDARFDFDKD